MSGDQFLWQLRTITKKIENKKREAVLWREIAEGLGQSTEGERVQSSGSPDRMAEAISRAVDYERAAEAMTWELINLQHEVILMIDGMGNENHSLILSEYYVHGMSLQEISHEWERSIRHIKRVKREAVAEFSEKYSDRIKKAENVTTCHL